MKNLQTVFRNGCTNLHSHERCITFLYLLTKSCFILLCCLFDDSHPDLHFSEKKVKQHFWGFLATFEECLLRSVAHSEWDWGFYLFGFLFLLVFSLWVPNIYWISTLCQMKGVQMLFSHSTDHLLMLLIIFFAVQKLHSLIPYHLSIFTYVACAFGVLPLKEIIAYLIALKYFPEIFL